jgi:hypothetical protein
MVSKVRFDLSGFTGAACLGPLRFSTLRGAVLTSVVLAASLAFLRMDASDCSTCVSAPAGGFVLVVSAPTLACACVLIPSTCALVVPLHKRTDDDLFGALVADFADNGEFGGQKRKMNFRIFNRMGVFC